MPNVPQEFIQKAISAALRFNRFTDAIHRLPGSPGKDTILHGRDMARYKDAVELLVRAEKMRNDAVKDLVAQMQGTWDDKTIYKAFNE